ncbi:MAG: response regulator transcription factor [Myxococcota bacterium]|nr:response regulator transcription factor [Myxococcota bacterium]
MEQHTVVVVEDEANARDLFAGMVEACPELRLVGAAETLADGLSLLGREAPDVLVVDLGLPDGSGIELIRAARQLAADTQCLVVTVFGDEKNVLAAIEAGARGYLLKEAADGLAGAIQALLAGGSPITPSIARHLLLRFQEPAERPDAARTPQLSARESEVLELVVKGFTFPEIGELLGISAHTVTTHIRRIYRKLEVRSRSEAVFEALQLGLVRIRD